MKNENMGVEELFLAPEDDSDVLATSESTPRNMSSMDSVASRVKTPKRVEEIIEQRGKNFKVFRMSDGTEQAVFSPSNIHVFDDKTQMFEDVDTNLTEDEDGIHFTCGKNNFIAKFSREEDNDDIFSIEEGMHKVTVCARKNKKNKNKGAKPHLHKKDKDDIRATDILTFTDVEPNTDYEYSVEGSGVKENIVVKKPSAIYRYPFELKCDNVTAQFDETAKRIAFVSNETGNEVFFIPSPFMTDAKGVNSTAVDFEMKTTDSGRVFLTVTADSDWINAPDRAFPVIIDPQIKLSNASVISTYSWCNGSLCSATEHTIGGDGNGDCNSKRMYLEFNMPTLPRNPRIKKAELRLFQHSSSSGDGDYPCFGLYNVTEDIYTGTCTPLDDSKLIDYARMKIGHLKNGNVISYTFDITTLVDMVNKNESYSPRLVIKMLDESIASQNNITLYGSSYSGSYAPQIMITYESSYGVNTSHRTHTHELGRFGQGSIDLQCGNLMFESEDFAWPGNRMPVTIKHLFNSALAGYTYTNNSSIKLTTAAFSAMKLGYGFKLNIMQSMVATTFIHEGTSYSGFVYVGENGEETFFKMSETKKCYDNNSQCYNLYEDVNDEDILYDPEKRTLNHGDATYQFDGAGRLIKISDTYVNHMDITYTSNRISSVTDGAGREFGFAYNSSGLLTSITAPDDTYITYGYTGYLLTSVTYPDGAKVVINYSSNKPKSVTLKNALGAQVYRVAYSFSGNRLVSVTEYGSDNSIGTESTYEYSVAAGRTIVKNIGQNDSDEGNTDNNELKTVYTFDDDGNIVSEYAYSEDTGNVGVTCSASGINPLSKFEYESNANNLLTCHNFESLSSWPAESTNYSDTFISTVWDDSKAKLGTSAMKIETSNTSCTNNGVYQRISTLPSGEYTFSAYVKVDSAVQGGANRGVYLRVTDTSGNILTESERLVLQDEEYVRLNTSFALSSDKTVIVHILIDGKTTIYVNAPQLENNPFVSSYNMLENGNFEHGVSGWIKDSGVYLSVGPRFNMKNSLMMMGSISGVRRAYQEIKVKSAIGTRETFTLSGWAAGYGLPAHARDNCENAIFELRAEIFYKNIECPEVFTAPFSTRTDEWQLASVQVAKTQYKEIDKILIYCDYSYNFGNAFFDDIQFLRNSIETGLVSDDFENNKTDSNGTNNTTGDSTTESKGFAEAIDAFGNTITETTFTDGKCGTIYRSFKFNDDDNCMAGNDAGNNLIEETDARGNKTYYAVDSDTSRNEEVTDRCGNKTAYEYDNSGRTTKVISKKADDTELANVSYSYDAFDNMTEIARGDGMKYALAYNEFHNLESIGIDGKAESLIKYTYKNGNGRLKQMTYANGHTMKAVYNSVGQMVAEKWFATEAQATSSSATPIAHYKYVYDGHGNIVRSIDIIAKKEYNYEYEDGRILRATENNVTLDSEIVTGRTLVNSIRYYYNAEGQLTQKVITPASGSAFTYDYTNTDANTTVSFLAGGKNVTSYSNTDHFGRELQLGSATVTREFSYHRGTVTPEHTENDKVRSCPTTQLVSKITISDGRTIEYEYDAEARITKVTDSVDGTTEYTYDALGQLLTEAVNGTVVNTMTYDNYGNITKKNGKAYTYGNSKWKDLLTSYNGQSITYDAQGNPTSYLGHTLTWEKGRQLKKFDNIEYTYNANGIRTSKKVNGVLHTYTLDGTKILRETWGSNTLIPLYDNEDSVCGILYNSVPYYFIKNLQGDIIAIVDQSAKTVARYSYDAWGKITSITGSNINIAHINPFRYRGYYYDEEIDFYYLQSRYYDASVGRFINCDAVDCLISGETANKLNQFSYCENDPVDNDDPNGMWIQYVIGAAIGGILNVVFYVIDCAIAKVKVNVWKALLNFLNGAVNGLIAATGAALIWQIVAGIASGLVSLFIGASKPTLEDLIIAVICGILSGILAGTLPKGANKHINYLMKNFGKKVKASIFKSGFGKNLMKAAKYVFKNSKKLLWKFIKSYCIPNTLISATPRIKAALGV